MSEQGPYPQHSNNNSSIVEEREYESRYTHLENTSNHMYGIPQSEYQYIYDGLQPYKEDSSAVQSPSFDSLDYGQKLIANHKMLKDLLLIVDSKIQNRQSKVHKQKESYVQKSVQRQKVQKSQSVQNMANRLQSKMLTVKQKLKDIISFIDSEVKIKGSKKIVEEQIKFILEADPSLVYSKDFSEGYVNDSLVNKKIIIDMNKLNNAKEVISHEYLQPSHEIKREYIQGNYMESSLQRISQAQSAENADKQSPSGSYVTELKKRTENQVKTAKNSIRLEQQTGDLDQTGKMIMSTINKKITSTTTIQHQHQKQDTAPQSLTETENNHPSNKVNVENKKSKFWEIGNRFHTIATVTSHQSLEESKKINSSQFKYSSKIQAKEVKPVVQKRKMSGHFPKGVKIQTPQPIAQPRSASFSKQRQPQLHNVNNVTQTYSNVYLTDKNSPVIVQVQNDKETLQRSSSTPYIKESNIIKQFSGAKTLERSQFQPRTIPAPQRTNSYPINNNWYNPEIRNQTSVNINNQQFFIQKTNKDPRPFGVSQQQRGSRSSSRNYSKESKPQATQPTSTPTTQILKQSQTIQNHNDQISYHRPFSPTNTNIYLPRDIIQHRDVGQRKQSIHQSLQKLDSSQVRHSYPTSPYVSLQRHNMQNSRPQVMLPPRYPRSSQNLNQSRQIVRQKQQPIRQYSYSKEKPALKKELPQIMETTEYSEMSATRRIDSTRNFMDSRLSPKRPSNMPLSGQSSGRRLKKRGIQVTNRQFPSRRFVTQS